jgi:hypothetical protein
MGLSKRAGGGSQALHSPTRAESGEVILNPSYELIFNFDGSQCPNRHGNEFYYQEGGLELLGASTSNLGKKEKKEIFQ